MQQLNFPIIIQVMNDWTINNKIKLLATEKLLIQLNPSVTRFYELMILTKKDKRHLLASVYHANIAKF